MSRRKCIQSEARASTLPLLAWALYDWANSAFSAIIQTFVFAAYFTQYVARDDTSGSLLWGLTNSIAALGIAICGPILGAIADQGGYRKRWILLFTYLCIISTALLWFVTPSPDSIPFALVLVGIGIFSAELSFVFYNAMLPSLTGSKRIGRWSGWGWSLGYAGGMACLIIAMIAFINNEQPWFSLDKDLAEHVRATFPLAAIWYLVFSLPLFIYTPDTDGQKKRVSQAIQDGMSELLNTFKHIKQYKSILRFLIAHMVYIDGLTTLFAFGGVYAASTFGMDAYEILLFGISLSVTSGLGAASFALIDDKIGGKKLILLSLAGAIISGSCLLLANSSALFWVFGMILGIFVGPIQSGSRSYMARVAPPELRNEMFGFFALSGKATAFLGPLLVGWVTYLTQSHRAGISTIVVFFVVGALLMLTVKESEQYRE